MHLALSVRTDFPWPDVAGGRTSKLTRCRKLELGKNGVKPGVNFTIFLFLFYKEVSILAIFKKVKIFLSF